MLELKHDFTNKKHLSNSPNLESCLPLSKVKSLQDRNSLAYEFLEILFMIKIDDHRMQMPLESIISNKTFSDRR